MILKRHAPVMNAVKTQRPMMLFPVMVREKNVTAVIIRLQKQMVGETTSQGLKRCCLSAGGILSYVYLLSPDAWLSDPACDVLVVPLNSLPVSALLETRTSVWGTKGTLHYPELSGNDNNHNSFNPCKDIMNLTYIANYLCSSAFK